jgi:hypothetical protein
VTDKGFDLRDLELTAMDRRALLRIDGRDPGGDEEPTSWASIIAPLVRAGLAETVPLRLTAAGRVALGRDGSGS